MDLIKNKDAGKWAGKGKFCTKCKNQGRIKVVQECDKEKFDELFEKYDKTSPANDITYERAIDDCRYDYFHCPDCEEGQKYKDEYPKYEGK